MGGCWLWVYGDDEWWVVCVCVCVCVREREREREREMNKKWIVFRCDVKNRTFYVGWIVKWVVKIDKVVFWVVKS